MREHRVYRVLLAGTSDVIMKGMEAVLMESGEFQVVGSVRSMARCQEKITMLSPDAVILDPLLVDNSRRPSMRSAFFEGQSPVLIGLVGSLFPEEVLRQFDDTVSVFDQPANILRKIRSAAREGDKESGQAESAYELSDREKEILVSVARGLANKEIAEHHNISIHTVISHRKNIARKTGIKTVSGLTVYALLNSLMDMSDVEQ